MTIRKEGTSSRSENSTTLQHFGPGKLSKTMCGALGERKTRRTNA
jgi:hypothetical protein